MQPSPGWPAVTQVRSIQLFEIFNKEKAKERKQNLKDEMQRGYFDDFREMRDTQGKMFAASTQLIAPQAAPAFPQIQVVRSDGSMSTFPPSSMQSVPTPLSTAAAKISAQSATPAHTSQASTLTGTDQRSEAPPGKADARLSSANSPESASKPGPSSSSSGAHSMQSAHSGHSGPAGEGMPSVQAASPSAAGHSSQGPSGSQSAALVCIAFRAGAEEWIRSWTQPYKAQYAGRPGAAVYELSLVESKVMSLWPFRQMIVSAGSKPSGASAEDAAQMPTTYLFHFGDTEVLRQALQMTNRLTGYIYLVDSSGRVRWRGSGLADAQELRSLLSCTDQLLTSKT
ncbi:hypothetical protein WJX72_009658 [[Myrmecia] bisecta]|uniref:Uncharacterized protein n=1 Tax=[Myrmecia] bisecta TaxID=41462 RepID=A0AAW1Q7E7_9CHLO